MTFRKPQHLTLGRLFNHLALLVLVLLWILPTIGLLVSSFRDKDQLAYSGWWTALSTSEQNAWGRTGKAEDQIEKSGNYVISGTILEPGEKTILTFNTNFRNLSAYKSGETMIFKDDSHFSLQADGKYEWVSQKPFTHKRGKRISMSPMFRPRFRWTITVKFWLPKMLDNPLSTPSPSPFRQQLFR